MTTIVLCLFCDRPIHLMSTTGWVHEDSKHDQDHKPKPHAVYLGEPTDQKASWEGKDIG